MGKKYNKVLCILFMVISFSCEPQGGPVNYSNIEGIYTCQESSSHSGVRKYFVEVDKVGSSDNLYILTNFHNLGDSEFIYAELRQDSLILENQTSNELSINGAGIVDPGFREIQLNYNTYDGIIFLDFNARLSR